MGLLIGTPCPDSLEATAEDQVLKGLGGADRLTSRFDGSTLLGGAGSDLLRADVTVSAPAEGEVGVSARQHGGSGADHLTVDLETTADFGRATMALWVDGGFGDDTIEVAANLGGAFASVAIDARIFGGAGDDHIVANVVGEANRGIEGPLRVRGGTGDDVIEVQLQNLDRNGSDSGAAELRILGEDGDDEISAFVRGGANGSVTVANRVDGGTGDDVVDAWTYSISNNSRSFQTNELFGRGGGDILRARHEGASIYPELANLLDGGRGSDQLLVAQDTDELRDGIEWLSLDNDLIGGLGTDSLRVDLTLALGAFQVDNRLEGGLGDDVLTVAIDRPGILSSSQVVHSLLAGGRGADRLTVIDGTDSVLAGGAGVDTFVIDPSATQAQTISLADFDESADRMEFAGLADGGAPGLADDLDAIAVFSTGPDGVLVVTLGALTLRLPMAPAGADSFADLVDDPGAQLASGESLLA